MTLRPLLLCGLCVGISCAAGCVATSGRALQPGMQVVTSQPASIEDVRQAVQSAVSVPVGRLQAQVEAAVSLNAKVADDVSAIKTSQNNAAGRDVKIGSSAWPLLIGVLGVVLILAAARLIDGWRFRRQAERHHQQV